MIGKGGFEAHVVGPILRDARRFEELGLTELAALADGYATEVLAGILSWQDELLDLDQAAAESGFTKDHLGFLIRDQKIPNSGRKGSPRIRRKHLPRKPGTFGVQPVGRQIGLKEEIARSVVNSHEGGNDD